MTIERTYRDLREELDYLDTVEPELLSEFRIIRGTSAVVLASKSKQHGDKCVQHARRGQSHLNRIKSNDTPEEQLAHIKDALEEMFDCIIDTRLQIGSFVGIALASVLISERSNKELNKILKQKRRWILNMKPHRKPTYLQLDSATKDGLSKIAKYRHTTLSNLIEEGSRYIIHRESQRIREDMSDLRDVNSMVRH